MKKFCAFAAAVVLAPILAWSVLMAALSVYVYLCSDDIEPGDSLLIEEPAVPDNENQVAAFLAVTNLYPVSYDELKICTDYRQARAGIRPGWKRQHLSIETLAAQVDQVLSKNAAFLEGLHKAAQYPPYDACRKTIEKTSFTGLPFATLHGLKLLHLKALREMDRGEYQKAFETARDCLGLSCAWRGGTCCMVSFMASAGGEGMALVDMAELACKEDAPTELLKDIARIVTEPIEPQVLRDRFLKSYYEAVCGEIDAAQTEDELEELLGPVFLISGGDEPSDFEKKVLFPLYWRRFAFKPEETKRELAEYVSLASKGSLPSPVDRDVLIHRPNWRGHALTQYIACMLTHPEFDGIGERSAILRIVTRLTVAAQLYRRAHDGAYPDTLDALVPEFLDKVPRDPYAPGHPFNYDAKTRCVWSVGPQGDFTAVPAKKPHNGREFKKAFGQYAGHLYGPMSP